ncbi:Maf-like protein [Corchorus olitorius]|uniref:Maf-like protein n=1 Tax=Corchorus olitorius TaxID=93759 RepID=A0A1R3IP90_9ROSI|nr:Maf-like protein [Corchorus olitorius]
MAAAAAGESSFKIILGSSSMARQRILAEMGYEFEIIVNIDEKSIRKEKPEDLVTALAEAKCTVAHALLLFCFHVSNVSYCELANADAIISRLQNTGILEKDAQTTLLITADTVVVYKGTIREKPCSEEEAREFIKGYSGGNAAVVGSVLVTNLQTGTRKGGWESAEVYFHDIPDEVIDSLIDEGIPFKVAGGLMLEHPLTLPFVDAVIGATDTVMGLSKSLTEKLMEEALIQQAVAEASTMCVCLETGTEDLITISASQKAVAVLFHQLFARYDAYTSTFLSLLLPCDIGFYSKLVH